MKILSNIFPLLKKAIAGGRLSLEEGTALMETNDLLALGQAADIIRQRLHPERQVTFVIDRNINYTNVCLSRCRFCAFYRDQNAPDAYIIGWQELYEKIAETVDAGGTELLIQGGLHPDLTLDYYLDMLRYIKSNFDIHIHSFSPPEVMHMVKGSGLSIKEVLEKLRAAGLDSLPGGGAEILVDRVRGQISPEKIGWQDWMKVMLTAHSIGMKTTATMMFGHVETNEERVLHMIRVREAQDQTGGFTAFIPWSFQPKNTQLSMPAASGVEYLKTLAVARLVIDNVPNIQASWVTQGAKIAQVALSFGANDFGSTMLEENVVRAAGVTYRIALREIIHCIKNAGFTPAQRTTDYRVLRMF
ncbi:Radical SAM domain protein [Desulfofarcimen acetoxidans DSM 771]|uniref:Cyclic dehypoxanthine futalosine synthase n=1 Tax=Desulfofarcimen acetoxidans (strain ATCC 49208 / DSM 771 / KCTC 5769 / VKM B-1644 / 5575) TaxID=485916 RepID=C8VWF0_DESAS|nr:cyclic dehypoxanthinyl futalosine synthase [Desulfofarcimen acetoxidans]ACV62502.1 Radical SAM domain protein [Desulfofarcimen acetoxidans DSM 771]